MAFAFGDDGQHFCEGVLEFEVDALGDLEVEADSAVGAVFEGQTEVQVVGAGPDGVEVDAEGGQYFFLVAQGGHFQEFATQLELVHHELENAIDLPLDGADLT